MGSTGPVAELGAQLGMNIVSVDQLDAIDKDVADAALDNDRPGALPLDMALRPSTPLFVSSATVSRANSFDRRASAPDRLVSRKPLGRYKCCPRPLDDLRAYDDGKLVPLIVLRGHAHS